MEIDHFDPTQKNRVVQDYFNLLLATRHCNLAKSDFWPNPRQRREGLRLLNPTRERDWGEHIVEDPVTHRLWGKTPTGTFHIRRLDLNARHLMEERRDRARLRRRLEGQPVKMDGVWGRLPEALSELKRLRAGMIRDIPEEPDPAVHESPFSGRGGGR